MDYRCEEQIWLTNVRYLWLSPHTSWALTFFIDIKVCTISRGIGVNIERKYVIQMRYA